MKLAGNHRTRYEEKARLIKALAIPTLVHRGRAGQHPHLRAQLTHPAELSQTTPNPGSISMAREDGAIGYRRPEILLFGGLPDRKTSGAFGLHDHRTL